MKDISPLNPQEVNFSSGRGSFTTVKKDPVSYNILVQSNSENTKRKPEQDDNLFPESIDMDRLLEELKKYNSQLQYYDKKVKLSVNEKIDRVIITVINKNTNEVIYEYPYKELQELAAHLKEMTGFLFDKKA